MFYFQAVPLDWTYPIPYNSVCCEVGQNLGAKRGKGDLIAYQGGQIDIQDIVPARGSRDRPRLISLFVFGVCICTVLRLTCNY